eukprot:3698432-Rhodomonas_salina.4
MGPPKRGLYMITVSESRRAQARLEPSRVLLLVVTVVGTQTLPSTAGNAGPCFAHCPSFSGVGDGGRQGKEAMQSSQLAIRSGGEALAGRARGGGAKHSGGRQRERGLGWERETARGQGGERERARLREEALVKDLKRVSQLTKVALSWWGQSVPKCIGLLGTSEPLVHLDLKCDYDAGTAGTLAEVLGEFKSLFHLDLSRNQIDPVGAWKLAGRLGECKALAHLNLSWNKIGDEGAGRLAGVLGEGAGGFKALAHLDLSVNEIGDEGAGKLVGVLEECKVLGLLGLIHTCIEGEGAGRLAGVLGKCKALAYLHLQGNVIGDGWAGRLAGVQGKCRTLARLGLCNNEIGDEGAGRLAGVLGQCTALGDLGLMANCIGDEGAGRLVDALGECKTLRELDLRGNAIAEEVGQRLADLVPNTCLVHGLPGAD